MQHLFVLDPLERLSADADTSIAFMRAAAARGHHIDTALVGDLEIGPDTEAGTIATTIRLQDGPDWFAREESARRRLSEYDVVWMRKDPPFDMAYLFATYILSQAAEKTLVVNDPSALREGNEKLFILRFPHLCPPTLVSSSIERLMAFRRDMGGQMVVKPLDGAGGQGVFHIRTDDPNAGTIMEMSTAHGTRLLMAQRYIPEVRIGDKRIILVEGRPAGAVLRVPKSDEARANFHAGGRAVHTDLNKRDLEICAAIGPTLRRMGVVFAGIDVLGNWLTEINVTSPTGIREIKKLDGTVIEEQVLDAVESRLAERK